MKVEKLSDMTKGWFIGNFEPSLHKTNECEIGVKSYNAGDYEKKHYTISSLFFILCSDMGTDEVPAGSDVGE